jgi:hypothetical protein
VRNAAGIEVTLALIAMLGDPTEARGSVEVGRTNQAPNVIHRVTLPQLHGQIVAGADPDEQVVRTGHWNAHVTSTRLAGSPTSRFSRYPTSRIVIGTRSGPRIDRLSGQVSPRGRGRPADGAGVR